MLSEQGATRTGRILLKNAVIVCLRVALSSAIVCACPWMCFGQTDSATVTGVVSDPTHAVIPGAQARIKNVGTGTIRVAASDVHGNFTFVDLAPGVYTLRVDHAGFKTKQIDDLTLNVGDDKTLPVLLDVGESSDTIIPR